MRVVPVLGVAVAIVTACGGQKLPPQPPRHTGVAFEMTEMRLANGLRVLHILDPHATGIGVTMRYQVGAVDEAADQRGVAHVVEHLMFEPLVDGMTIYARVQDITSTFNAFTSLDATTYFARASSDHLEELLAMEALRLGTRCASVTDAAFERQREVVRNELRQGREDMQLSDALHTSVYAPGHPYHRAGGGNLDSVATLTREAACAFADAHYAPQNAVLVISGPLPVAAARSRVAPPAMRAHLVTTPAAFRALGRTAQHLHAPETEEPPMKRSP